MAANNNSVDLRVTGYLGPVRNQGRAANCYLFPPIVAIESLYHKETGQELELSIRDCFDNLVKNEDQKRKGKSIVDVFSWLIANGCVSEASWPYRGGLLGPSRSLQERPVLFRIRDYDVVWLDQMKEELRVNGPVVVSIPWILEMDQFRGEGIYHGPANPDAFVPSPTNLVVDHALLVAGYDSVFVDEEEVEYWIVKNSHGDQWGHHGYGKFNMSIMYNDRPLIDSGLVPRGICFNNFFNGLPYN